MEKILLKKMIRNCFLQYEHDLEFIPLNEEDYEKLAAEVEEIIKQDPTTEVFEVVNDVVYEYLRE
ncbi:YqzH family protein [Sutcliffiella deserti]|uniref:YqzH family protein n=1 Tax=Sutcliffiella deserti TaxID=2875501 RepID=UPI001CBD5E43|nr:YqzH family protein [Sutcliffiella deserti]